MRFQYLNLVLALERKQWDDCGGGSRNNAWAYSWPGKWREFLSGTSSRLNGHEVCDCYRDQLKKEAMVENRYYHHPGSDVRVSFILWYGLHEHLPAGHNDFTRLPLENLTQVG